MEHHSNIVPWQLLAEATGARVRAAPITDAGELDLDALRRLLTRAHPAGRRDPRVERARHDQPGRASSSRWRTRAAFRCWSTARSRRRTCAVDVQALDCDFFVFSGHKLYGPTGIGVLYGREALLERMPPWQGGGDMIATCQLERTT